MRARERARLTWGAARSAALAIHAALALTACGEEVPAGGRPRNPADVVAAPTAPPATGAPDELLPGHLDLVVRVDLERSRVVLGTEPADALGQRLASDPLVSRALGRAKSAIFGLRVASLDAGDHVLVLEGDLGALELDEGLYAPEAGFTAPVRGYTRRLAAERAGTEAVVLRGARVAAFASPLEADALLRVARQGPDARRGAPPAEGLVSFDYRPGRLDPALLQRFPSIGRLLGQVTRVRGTARLADDGIRLDLDVDARGERGAERVARFFGVLREGAAAGEGAEDGAGAVLAKLVIEPVGPTVHVSTVVPAALVLRALAPEPAVPTP